MNTKAVIILLVVAFVFAGLLISFQSDVKLSVDDTYQTGDEGFPYVEIVNPAGYVNTNDEPFTIGQYVGEKVILLDIMTYSCINCQRTFPYVVDWYEKYKDDGLIVIGIHTPEFAFEKVKENVERELGKFGITFPVVLDNDYGTWRALGNRYWPRKYLIDINGNIVYDHIGEGAYEETEAKIVELLKERAEFLGEEIDNEQMTQITTETSGKKRSPEVYFGASRNEYLFNGERGQVGEQTLHRPDTYELNELNLLGVWNIQPEYAETKSSDAYIAFRFQADEVNLVAEADVPIDVEIRIDGKFSKTVTIEDATLYPVFDGEYGEHLIEIKPASSGFRAFAFTFGA